MEALVDDGLARSIGVLTLRLGLRLGSVTLARARARRRAMEALVDDGLARSIGVLTLRLGFRQGSATLARARARRRAIEALVDDGLARSIGVLTLRLEFRQGSVTLARARARRRAMEALVDDGLARLIGVSNFSEAQIEELLGCARIPPCANQVELHPRLAQRRLVGYCARKVAPARPAAAAGCAGVVCIILSCFVGMGGVLACLLDIRCLSSPSWLKQAST